jgi:hypothetical protein
MSTEPNATPAESAATEGNEPANLDTVVETVEATETAPEGDPEPEKVEAPDDEDSEQGDDKPRKRSRTDRLKDRIRDLEAQVHASERLRDGASKPEAGKPPQETDFNGDYAAFERATRQFEVEQAFRRVRDEDNQRSMQERATELQREKASLYRERAVEAKSSIPDFEKVLESARGAQVRDDIADFIQESEKGPHLAYHLAKHPDQLRDLNGKPPAAALRELARIEARLSTPAPKKQTSAPAPVRTVTGGAAASPDLSKMSMDEYAAYRKKQGA